MTNQTNNIATTMVALYDFEAEEQPEISMKKGDQIEMLDMDPALNGWAYARLKKTGQEGYVPVSYLGTSNRANKDNKRSGSRSSSPKPTTRYENNKSEQNENINNRNYTNRNASYQRANYNDSSMNN
eukprot:141106_1